MPREKTLRVRLSGNEFELLRQEAEQTDRLISEVIRDFIKGLQKSPNKATR